MRLKQVITNAILDALQRHRGNQSRAAKELGVSRGTVIKYLKEELERQKRMEAPKPEPIRTTEL